MPFTPYHFGPALLVGVLLFPFLDFAAMMVASVILDIEPFLVLYLGLGGPLHGTSHTYLVATLVAVLVTGILWLLRTPIASILAVFGIVQEPKKIRIFVASLIGTYSHVFMDSFLYGEMNPLLPILGNPFVGLIARGTIYQFCFHCGMLGALLYFVRFCILQKEPVESLDSPF